MSKRLLSGKMTATEAMAIEHEKNRQEMMKMFSDTANLFRRFYQNGITHLFGQEHGIMRITKEDEKEMARLLRLYSKMNLL